MLASGDVVHLSESGAELLANNLKAAINDPSSILTSLETTESITKNTSIDYLSATQLTINVTRKGYYSFGIFTTDGKLIFSINQQFLNEGKNEVAWKANAINNNCAYLIRIQTDDKTENLLKYVY